MMCTVHMTTGIYTWYNPILFLRTGGLQHSPAPPSLPDSTVHWQYAHARLAVIRSARASTHALPQGGRPGREGGPGRSGGKGRKLGEGGGVTSWKAAQKPREFWIPPPRPPSSAALSRPPLTSQGNASPASGRKFKKHCWYYRSSWAGWLMQSAMIQHRQEE